jgi:hypothetical protein
MMGLKTLLCRWPALLALAAVSLALPALAGEDPAPALAGDDGATTAPQEQAASQAPAKAAPIAAAGLVAYIDPATGGLTATPTEEQRAAMRAALAALVNDSDQGLVEVTLPDGSVMLDLQGRFQEALVVLVAPDGTRRYECVSGLANTTDAPPAVAAPAAPTAAAAE